MRAVRFHENGGPEVLRVEDADEPRPGPGELVVEVLAAGVNFVDTYQRSGAYPLELPSGLGLEGAGVVRAVGEGVEHRREGDRVAWADQLGSYAQLTSVAADRTVLVPEGVEPDLAAALMLQGLTAHYLTSSTYKLGSDDTALVYAAAGGVGRLLVQLAKRRGARVLACTSTDDKEAEVRRLGADEVIRYRDVDLVAAVREHTDGQGVDVAYDSVGRDTFAASLDALHPRGMLVLYGASSGKVEPLDPQVLNAKGSLYLTRPSLHDYVATSDALEWRANALFELVSQEQLEVHVHARHALDEVAQAHRDLESGQTAGKLLLQP
ncbi:quinone oxidoreductase family protein [Egicoccus halophilus]|uniref:Alcohol dehydrogenase n=1 Tax=Egicoccus halophilus TaxID=1670830 RepID=A0A8J3AAZ2_9ACTN|nr:quinone oxidoreductase [Egicoccus halophilus]GGI06857.1 alcohol dehydrogenase [Egicoccus halophilus]